MDRVIESSPALSSWSGNIRHLVGTFPGPEGSPYQGGLFKVVSGRLSLHVLRKA